MHSFPDEPVAPREFIEDVVPALFAGLDLDPRAAAFDLKIGIRLEGDQGGEWTLHFDGGELGIGPGLAEDRGLTLVQSVADWRAALWEGRPPLVADLVASVRSGRIGDTPGAPPAANPEALRELERLPGRIDAVIEGDGEGDWRIGVHVGPGAIPDDANATVSMGVAEAESIRRGELHPLEALITGRLRLEGDLGLILQLQAIAMAASMPPPEGG